MKTFEFTAVVEHQDILVNILYDGKLVGNQVYDTFNWTKSSAIEDVKNEAEKFGWVGSGDTFYPPTAKTPEPEPPINPVQEKVDGVMAKLEEFNESLSPDMFNLEIPMMEDKDVLKKQIITQSSSIPDERIDSDTANQIVEAFPNNHPSLSFIEEKKKEVKTAVKQLGVKGKEITDGVIQLTTETIAAFVTIGSSAVIMPPGAGLPTAFSAVQGLFASLKAFQTKLNQLQPVIKELKYVEMLVDSDSSEGNAAISSVNVALSTINGLISGVASVTAPIAEVKNILGGTKVPGVNAPAEPIETPVLLWADNTTVGSGNKVYISSNAKGGTWQYKYVWTANNNQAIVNANSKAINVYPTTTTTYTVKVTNNDGTGSPAWGSVTIVVMPATISANISSTSNSNDATIIDGDNTITPGDGSGGEPGSGGGYVPPPPTDFKPGEG